MEQGQPGGAERRGIRGKVLTFFGQRSAVSGQRSAVSGQRSAQA